MTTDARLAALKDQADAAGREADALLLDYAAGLADAGAPVVPLPRLAFHGRLIDLMRLELGAAGPNYPPVCEHLGNLTLPRVAYWRAGGPGSLLCTTCAAREGLQARKARCALCDGVEALFTGAFRLPATVLERDGQRPIATVVMLSWICCQGCMGR